LINSENDVTIEVFTRRRRRGGDHNSCVGCEEKYKIVYFIISVKVLTFQMG
jgi:hypothetical protein